MTIVTELLGRGAFVDSATKVSLRSLKQCCHHIIAVELVRTAAAAGDTTQSSVGIAAVVHSMYGSVFAIFAIFQFDVRR